ncbi:MAG: hypothetical protein JWM44_2730 [Bacilli bacterium]|nr:hypothetical protein [Bacilli bacterium]
MKSENKSRWVGMGRWFKLKYLLLFRAKGGPAMVAKGFAIGLFIEMFTLPTFGLAAVLILPLVYFLRASLPGALVGFLFGKIIYLPLAFLNVKVGRLILPKHASRDIHFHHAWLEVVVKKEIYLIAGGIINGLLLGLILYFPVKLLLELYATRRKDKRKKRKAQLALIAAQSDTDTFN